MSRRRAASSTCAVHARATSSSSEATPRPHARACRSSRTQVTRTSRPSSTADAAFCRALSTFSSEHRASSTSCTRASAFRHILSRGSGATVAAVEPAPTVGKRRVVAPTPSAATKRVRQAASARARAPAASRSFARTSSSCCVAVATFTEMSCASRLGASAASRYPRAAFGLFWQLVAIASSARHLVVSGVGTLSPPSSTAGLATSQSESRRCGASGMVR
mmetsp:Transcript_10382/g.27888  ORF Transcript_10382/g.27888 Transcript_10382/m.27888 type:complete len:220 (+) Transcript_10382:1000-1659(+)